MSRQVFELEAVLQELIAEHQRLLTHLLAQQAAMKALDLKAMDAAAGLAEASRLRVIGQENRRRAIVQQLAQLHRATNPAKVTVTEIAAWYPARRAQLFQLRGQLRDAVSQVAHRSQVAGKVAGAVLGHLNTVVRLIAGAVEKAGTYTKHGVPRVSARIGAIEAVG